ncbi:hypothetical protein B2M26_10480 [Ferroacidibacillus organovorans]|uniref:Amino acid permease n=1 Tax=Ferroacidibacillus organovorans TaxID=1765683 RepID=A0A1V4ERX1_9BACL|nr:hypothetical protein B2M26_10480 [Ferroacidibacillus organovorans]
MRALSTNQALEATPNRLKDGSVSFWGALAISFGNMAPAASVLFLPQAMAQYTGTAVPLAFVFAMIASFFTAVSILHFTRRYASAGAAYTFNSMAFHKVFGFLSGWMLSLAYGLALPSNLLVFGYFAQGFIAQAFGINVDWMIFSFFALIAVTVLVIRGIRASARTDLVLIILETSVIVLLSIIIIAKGGAAGNTLAVFLPGESPQSFIGIIFGMLYGVGAFAGFEASATVSEETKDRFRTIPAVIFTTLVLGGILYVLVSYAISIGYGLNHGKELASATLPMSTLATRFVGKWMALLVDFAGMTSALGVSLASANASVRVIYSMGRDGVLPSWFSAVHHKYFTPHHAAIVLSVLSALLLLCLGLVASPYPMGFSYLVAAADVLGLTLYVSVNLAWMRMWWKDEQHYKMSWLIGVIPSLLGVIVMGIPLLTTIYPIPAWPLNLVLYLTFIYIAIGIVLGFVTKKRDSNRLEHVDQALSVKEM